VRATWIEVGARLETEVPAGASTVHRRSSLLVRLQADDGAWGQGEASPLPGYSSETLAECRAHIEAIDWQELPADVADRRAPLAGIGALAGSAAAARCALETAWLDLVTRRRGVAVSALLTSGGSRWPVPLSALLPAGPLPAVLAEARALMKRGIRTFKMKVGQPGALDQELAAVRAVRQVVGTDAALRLDANARWTPDEANAALAALVPLAPEVVEEPVAAARWRELALPVPVPVALDESLQGGDAGDELAERVARGACHAVVLKPMALGLGRSVELAERARSLGLGVIVTHLFDGPVGLAIAAELALAIPAPWAAGLFPHSGLTAWRASPPPQIGATHVVPQPGPGLGLPDLIAAAGAV
jgi:o-succinylbenzoate synthase